MDAVLFWLAHVTQKGREERESKMLTLGRLIRELKSFNPLLPIVYEDQRSPGEPHSYRGYYQDLAFEDLEAGATKTTAEFIEVLEGCVGKTFEGWKGGDFVMSEQTPLWRAYKGDCGEAVVSVKATNRAAVIKTMRDEAYEPNYGAGCDSEDFSSRDSFSDSE